MNWSSNAACLFFESPPDKWKIGWNGIATISVLNLRCASS
jgi:hypothetical protein